MIKTNYEKTLRLAAVCVVTLLFAACGQGDKAAAPSASSESDALLKVPVTTSSVAARDMYEKGLALADDLHIVEANEMFSQAVDADAGFAMGHFMLALTSQTAGEFFDATGKAKEFAAQATEGEQLYIKSLVAQSENDQATQREALDKLVSMYPKDERTHMQMGNYLFGQQDFAGAVEHLTHASAINPDFAGAYNMLGYSHRSLDNLDDAKAAFAKYVELIPDEANPYDSLAELMMEMGDYEGSIANYRKALDIDPNFIASYGGISVNQSLKGEADLAQEAAEQALAASRNFAERQGALFRSVTSHLFAGNADAAMEVAETMYAEAQVKGDHAAMGGIQEYMGDILMVNEDTAAAVTHLERALEHRQRANINDANKAQAKRTHLFKTAVAAMVGGEIDKSVALAAEYQAAAEASGTAFEKRRVHEINGYLAMGGDDYETGAALLDQANQTNPIVLYWAAVANKELGNTVKAVDLATRAATRNTLNANLPFFRGDALALLEELNSE